MLKGYYIHYNARQLIGVSKKIDMQLKELRKIANVEEIDIKFKTKNIVVNAMAILPFGSLSWDYSKAYESINNPDFIYIRGIPYDRKAYLFLKYIKKNYPNCKVLCEIPTYPYIKEVLGTLQGIFLFPKLMINRKLEKKFIDRYVSYSNDDIIDGVKTIKLMNGFDVESVKLKNGVIKEDEIRLIAVAMMQKAHGYERLIKGIHNYYIKGGKRNILFRLVGEGPETEYYKHMVKAYNIEDKILFYGQKSGRELDELYDKSDLAIEVLGAYKNNLFWSSSLKSREYLSRGIPIICAVKIDVFQKESFEYYLEFDNNNSAIDVEEIINFYDKIYMRPKQDVALTIRDYAYLYIDYSKTILPVKEYIINSRG